MSIEEIGGDIVEEGGTEAGDELAGALEPGAVIGSRYEVVKCLGSGQMGLVYACEHKELKGHKVAVKVLFPEVANDEVAAARFRNEIFASYGVSHPNVVRAYEYLKDGDLVAYTMEYVEGGDLADRLEEAAGGLPIEESISILKQICLGVQAIHDAGIVHRDLKPENILLDNQGIVKIADFGIARTGHGPRLTEHGGVLGTIHYVSPEYMLNSQVDWRSDIYAIGIIAYEMIVGDTPFKGDSVYQAMSKRLNSDPTPPSKLREECPAELDRIVLRATNRDPEKRYQSAAEIFHELQSLSPEDLARSSSGFIQIPKEGDEPYVGPVLDSVPGRDDEAELIDTEIPILSSKTSGDLVADTEELLEAGELEEPEIIDIAKEYELRETIHAPLKRPSKEALLRARAERAELEARRLNDSGANPVITDQVKVPSDPQLVDHRERKGWDKRFLIELFAIIIGLFLTLVVCFVLVKMFVPELFNSSQIEIHGQNLNTFKRLLL